MAKMQDVHDDLGFSQFNASQKAWILVVMEDTWAYEWP
jgi:hypothetical protein